MAYIYQATKSPALIFIFNSEKCNIKKGKVCIFYLKPLGYQHHFFKGEDLKAITTNLARTSKFCFDTINAYKTAHSAHVSNAICPELMHDIQLAAYVIPFVISHGFLNSIAWMVMAHVRYLMSTLENRNPQ